VLLSNVVCCCSLWWWKISASSCCSFVHPRCWFCATEVTSNIVFNCYLCLCSLSFLYWEGTKKKYYGEVYVKQIINMSGMGEWGGSWGGVFGYDLLKEVRYICNEYMQYLVIETVVNLNLPVNLYLPYFHFHIYS
jgi:hypothetical protein